MGIKFLFITLSLLLASTAFTQTRYVVLGLSGSQGRSEVERAGGQVHKNLRYINGMVAMMNEASANQLARRFPDAKIEVDAIVNAVKPDKPGRPGNGGGTEEPPVQEPQTLPWGVARVMAPEAHTITRGAGVTACIIDTGIDTDHPDLVNNIIGGENFVFKKGSVDPANYEDDNEHGTHVAGTIAALDNDFGVIGVAPEALIFAVKALDRRGSGYTSDIADGILSCITHGADVINMSLGSSSGTTIMQEAVRTAVSAGVYVVAAAGNEAGPVSYPAAYPEVIAVSSTTSSDSLSYFSNFGPEVEVAAPGSVILSTVPGGSYAEFSGTSMATPHAVGVIALMVAAGKSTLRTDVLPGLTVEEQGSGLVNAYKTVTE